MPVRPPPSLLVPSAAFAVMLGCVGCVEPPTEAPPPVDATPQGPPPLARGASVERVTLNQAVSILLVEDGEAVETLNAPVIAGRRGLLRVHLSTDDTWAEREVDVILALRGEDGAEEVRTQTLPVAAGLTPDIGDLDSTVVFALAPEDVGVGVDFSVEVRELENDTEADGSADRARAPVDGFAPLSATDWGGIVRIELVPIRYLGDGSGRLPDVSDEHVAELLSWVERLYPVAEVDIHVAAPWDTEVVVSAGSGMGDVLEALSGARDGLGIPWDRYVYGMIAPAETHAEFCAGGCTAGISYRASNPNSQWQRTSLGLGFATERASKVLLHEVGHAHDRGHAPCGNVGNPDGGYPYPNARLGAWGWDRTTGSLVDPSEFADVMSYCEPWWFSDYQYDALHRRIAMFEGIREGRDGARSTSTPAPYRVVSLRGAGEQRLGGVRWLAEAPGGEPVSVALLDADGARIGEVVGERFEFTHLPGGTVLLAEPAPNVAAIAIDGAAPLRLPPR